MRKLFYIFIVFFFTSCSLHQNQNTDFSNTISRCTNSSYISNKNDAIYGKLFTEYISLNSNCSWNGLSRGYFESLLKNTIKAKSFKVIKRLDYNNYEFSTYLINEKYYLNIIYNFTGNTDTFTLDYNGVLTQNLIRRFNPAYKNKYINMPRFDYNYSKSLVQMNFVNNYFNREVIRND